MDLDSLAKGFSLCLFLLWFLVGNPLMFGIVHFEKYGGDALKRNLIDMVR